MVTHVRATASGASPSRREASATVTSPSLASGSSKAAVTNAEAPLCLSPTTVKHSGQLGTLIAAPSRLASYPGSPRVLEVSERAVESLGPGRLAQQRIARYKIPQVYQ